MKIYPKIRKLQSGGQLSEVNFYPTVQYAPTSNVAITQGAWTPLKQTTSPDLTMDPDILKGVEGNTNAVNQFMSTANNKLQQFNRLSELEKRSNVGQSLMAGFKADLARVNELKNDFKSNQDARKLAKDNEVNDYLATDEYGNVRVLKPAITSDGQFDLNNTTIETVRPDEVYGDNTLKPLTHTQYLNWRAKLPSQSFNVAGDDTPSYSQGNEHLDKSLKAIADGLGKEEINRKIQYGYNVHHSDNLMKSLTFTNNKTDNIVQLKAASELAYSRLTPALKNGLYSLALSKLYSPNERGVYSAIERIPSNDPNKDDTFVRKNISYNDNRQRLNDLNLKISSETDPVKKTDLLQTRAAYVRDFQEQFAKSKVQDYFDIKHQPKDEKSWTYDNLSEGLYDKALGTQGEPLMKTDATLDAITAAKITPSITEKYSVTVDPKDPTATVHTNTYNTFHATTSPVSTNIEVRGNSKMLMNSYKTDPKRGYSIMGTETVLGRNLGEFSPDTQDNTFRIGVGQTTDSFFITDASNKRIYNITGSTKNKKTGNKWVTDLNTAREKIYTDNITTKDGKKYYNAEKGDKQWEEWLDKNQITQTPSIVNKVIMLVPTKSTNANDKMLLNSRSGYTDGLSASDKIALQNKVGFMNNKFNTQTKDVIPATVTYKEFKKGNETFERPTVMVGNEEYMVVVKEMVGIAANLSVINSIAKDEVKQTPNLTYTGDIGLHNKRQQQIIDKTNTFLQNVIEGVPSGIASNEEGGILPQFIPQEIKIKPLSLKDLY